MIDICTRRGCGHFQIGRSYSYLATRDQASLNLIDAVKSALDPTAALNPGGLGLNARGGVIDVSEYRAIRLERFGPSFRSAADIVSVPLRRRRGRERSWFATPGAASTASLTPRSPETPSTTSRSRPPAITGVEAIGVVEAVGEGVEDFEVGDAAATVRFGGGYREANTGPVSQFARVPGPEREWLALASTGVSALLALDVGEARAGETVAISAAAGGPRPLPGNARQA